MDKSIKKVEKMCTTYCKNMCINCENNCSILSKNYFGVQKAIIPPTNKGNKLLPYLSKFFLLAS